jgi:hypothetical protein
MRKYCILRLRILLLTILSNGGGNLKENNPIEYSGKVLNQRNNLTGPDDNGKVGYPKQPKGRVPIQDPKSK